MVDVTAAVRARVLEHFRNSGDPAEASVTFLGADRIIVLRFDGDGPNSAAHYVSLGLSLIHI